MASGAGLNRYGNAGGANILSVNANVTALATPLTAYGTIGLNDSGAVGLEAIGFTKWGFQLVPSQGQTAFSGYTITLYGTLDSRAYGQWEASFNPARYQNQVQGTPTPVVPPGSWFILPSPSEQTGTGSVANPLTSATPLLIVSMPLVAVRAVVTAVSVPTGACAVATFAVP